MQLEATYRGADDPFEGDRTVLLRGLPAGALVRKATLSFTPTAARKAFEERFVFPPLGNGDLSAPAWGVARTPSGSSVEIDFHARRTLAAVSGSSVTNASLAADVGGVFVDLKKNGAVGGSGTDIFKVLASGDLPGITVERFRLTAGTGTQAPAVDTVVVRSVPTNVSVRLGMLGPFFTRIGELAAPVTTPDFADVLRVFLLQAKVEAGAYVVPFTVHSDAIARLELTLEVEYLGRRSLLPDGLPEVVLPFDLSTFAQRGSAALSVRLPVEAHVEPGATTARVRGAFDDTRIADAAGTGEAAAAAEAVVAAGRAAAQAVEAAGDVVATGIDLELAPLTPTVRLSATLLGDSDGKPFGDSLLPSPLDVRLTRDKSRAAAWITAPFEEPFHFEVGRRYWVVLQALDGEASWAAAATTGDAALQVSTDGGLSWTAATDARLPGPLAALHRLRVTPPAFEMPIALDVGSGQARQRVSLRRFEPLGRVDLTLDTPELAKAFDEAVAVSGTAACPTAEHLANGEFDDWLRAGGELAEADPIEPKGSARALALTRDGRRLYVATVGMLEAGSTASQGAFLEPFDLLCGTAAPVQLDAGGPPLDPMFVALHPNGERAYVFADMDGFGQLVVVDTAAGARIGDPLEAKGLAGPAIGPDGDRLFFLRADDVVAIDARTVDRLALENGHLLGAVEKIATVPLQGDRGGVSPPLVVAGRGPETRVVFAEDVRTKPGRLVVVDLSQPENPAHVDVGERPVALAATPDGRRVVVACEVDKSLGVVDVERMSVATVSLPEAPIGVALADDGTRAAVLSASGVTIYDLGSRRQVAAAGPLGRDPSALAGSAALDELFVAYFEEAYVTYIVTGAALPVEWTLTSGAVEPRCLAGDVVAVLGSRARRPGERTPPRGPSALSQVVPVTPGCRYALSFTGVADQPDSVAEVLWRDTSCGLAQSEQIPVAELDRSQGATGAPAPSLVLHRKTFDAPAGADQAEVRFSVPSGAHAMIGAVSLRGSDAAVRNEDLRERDGDRPAGWDLDPPGSQVSLEPAAGAVTVENPNGTAAALVQSITVTAGSPIEVELTARVVRPGADQGPALELRYLAAGNAAAPPALTVPLSPSAFDRVVLEDTVPAGITAAELRLSLPAGAALEVARVAVRQPTTVEVPVAFRAQTRGELAVQAAEVAYDRREAQPPPVPDRGLCPSTAPGDSPSAEPRHACGCCGSREAVEGETRAATPAGRPATVRRCASCGAPMIAGGGRPAPGVLVVLPSKTAVHSRGTGMPSAGVAVMPAITDIRGIGAARARRLARVGLGTVDRLAAASPPMVVAVLPQLSTSGAEQLLAQARRLVSAAR